VLQGFDAVGVTHGWMRRWHLGKSRRTVSKCGAILAVSIMLNSPSLFHVAGTMKAHLTMAIWREEFQILLLSKK
jgi:hypothetical protein